MTKLNHKHCGWNCGLRFQCFLLQIHPSEFELENSCIWRKQWSIKLTKNTVKHQTIDYCHINTEQLTHRWLKPPGSTLLFYFFSRYNYINFYRHKCKQNAFYLLVSIKSYYGFVHILLLHLERFMSLARTDESRCRDVPITCLMTPYSYVQNSLICLLFSLFLIFNVHVYLRKVITILCLFSRAREWVYGFV